MILLCYMARPSIIRSNNMASPLRRSNHVSRHHTDVTIFSESSYLLSSDNGNG